MHSTQQMGDIVFIMCSGYTVDEARLCWIINWDENNVSLCDFFSFSLQSLLRLIGSPSQTQGKSQECYLLVSHHIKGMSGYYSSRECVTDICCSVSQLLSRNCPSNNSRKTERKCEKERERGRNNDCHSRHRVVCLLLTCHLTIISLSI